MASSDSMLNLIKSLPGLEIEAIGIVASRSDKHPLPGHKIDVDLLQSQSNVPMNDTTVVIQESYSICKRHGRKRDKAKRFMVEKGPRIAGAAATIAMFIFDIVSNCC